MTKKLFAVLAAVSLFPISALAESPTRPGETLPEPKSDNDPRPPVAAPATPEGGMVEQAGIGGQVAYGRAGVVELGGSASFTTASNFSNLTFSPTVGWFFQDNLELSGLLNVNFLNVAGSSSVFTTALIEPSYHLPFSQNLFGFLGVGAGLGYSNASGGGAGFALAPRLGLNVLLGRSGIFTPAVFFNYSTVNVSGNLAQNTVTLNAAYGLQLGYTVML
jgi:hypothetical protein